VYKRTHRQEEGHLQRNVALLKISENCRKIKLRNFSILLYYSIHLCYTHSRLRC